MFLTKEDIYFTFTVDINGTLQNDALESVSVLFLASQDPAADFFVVDTDAPI